MAEHMSGLRFDIYERVHLVESSAEMTELDTIELVPHIQVAVEGEQVLLKGELRLTGQYHSDSVAEMQTLEHVIPVEITLPLNRVQRMEDISVQIENFDFEQISPRSLNVTGVLSLSGIHNVSETSEPHRQDFFPEEDIPNNEIWNEVSLPEQAIENSPKIGFKSSPNAEEQNREAAQASPNGMKQSDELEWKKLFLGEGANDQKFKKMRMCIVQKEETIEGIAERYKMSAREIILYNRLNSQQIAVGQVIYIP